MVVAASEPGGVRLQISVLPIGSIEKWHGPDAGDPLGKMPTS